MGPLIGVTNPYTGCEATCGLVTCALLRAAKQPAKQSYTTNLLRKLVVVTPYCFALRCKAKRVY